MPPKKDDECCKSCNKKESNVSQFIWISCDCCKMWYHSQCQNLNKSEANLITKSDTVNKGVKWFCVGCLPSLVIQNSNQQGSKLSTKAKLDQITLSIQSLNEKIEHQATKFEEHEKSYAEVLKVNSDNIKKTLNVNTNTQTILQKTLDISDAESRKLNAILYGLPEDNNKSALNQVTEFLKKDCFTQSTNPTQALRLGAKIENKSRPIKVKFNDENSKWEFIKRVNDQLKGQGFFCKVDNTKEYRDQEYKLRQQVKRLREDNKEGSYRICSMNIQQKDKTTGEWVVLKPVDNNHTVV